MTRVVLIGATGQLGTDLCSAFGGTTFELVALRHADMDVCDDVKVRDALASLKPNVVINTAAFHKVELCEQQPAQAFAVNCLAVLNLGRTCQAIGARLVHFSTDYVFGGSRQTTPYTEESPPNPLNVYGVSKVAGEHCLRNACEKHLLLRVSGLFGIAGASGKGGNFVETMLRLGREQGTVTVVTDQVFSPTYTVDLARKVVELVEAEAQGVFHVTNSGCCSWNDFAKEIFALARMEVEVKPTTSATFGANVVRPGYSVLANQRLRAQGFSDMRPWQDALADYLAARRERASR